jgi:hypothetical protein
MRPAIVGSRNRASGSDRPPAVTFAGSMSPASRDTSRALRGGGRGLRAEDAYGSVPARASRPQDERASRLAPKAQRGP